MTGHYPAGNLQPDIRPVGKCLSSVPCQETMFDHKEHQMCQRCKRRVPVPLASTAFANSVMNCAMCRTGAEDVVLMSLARMLQSG